MPAPVQYKYGSTDLQVNADNFTNVFSINFNNGTLAVTNPLAVDLSTYIDPLDPVLSLVAQMTDNPDGTVSNSVVVDPNNSGVSDNLEGLSEGVGINGAFKAYLDATYGAGNWSAVYTGASTYQADAYAGNVGSANPPGPDPFKGIDEPIIAISPPQGSASPFSTSYFVLSNTSVPPSGTPGSNTAYVAPYYYSCFEKNTLITTPAGDVVVSELMIGDKVLTQDGRAVDIKWIGYQAINAFFAKKHDSMPIKITAGALGDDLPKNDLYVSPDHAFLMDGLLVNASALVNGTSITQMQAWVDNVEYYHIETEDHEIILAEGVPAETLLDNSGREKFANYKEFQELYPQGKVTKELDFPRVKFPRQLPEQIKKRLAAYQGAAEMAA